MTRRQTPTWGYQEKARRIPPHAQRNHRRAPIHSKPHRSTGGTCSEEFENEPALNAGFIADKTQEVLARALAVDTATSEQWSAQIIMDILHDSHVARMMPAYAVPGLIDHF